MPKHLPVLILLLASIVTHILFFGQPKQTVFDEVHFGKFVSGYFTHEYFFDIHPPLGKLLIAGTGYFGGFDPKDSSSEIGFGKIGEEFNDTTYRTLRLLPTIAGILLPIIFFYLLLELGISRIGALAGGAILVLDNALLTQSRFILLDIFLLLFGITAWLLYAKYRNTGRSRYVIFASTFAGLSLSVKWTGIAFLGIIGLIELISFIKKRNGKGAIHLATLIVVPFVIYYGVFAIHLGLLQNPGPGDAFMKQGFQERSTFSRFAELNEEMYSSNKRLTATHPYSSKWYSWPFMARSIYYWNSDMDQRIYLTGNPAIWWTSTFAILYLLLSLMTSLPSILRKKNITDDQKSDYYVMLFIAIAYIANMLPFVGIPRVMFLYHYFPALIVAIIALVYLIDKLKNRQIAFAGFLIVSLVAFIFFAPLSYGTILDQKQFDSRIWLRGWR